MWWTTSSGCWPCHESRHSTLTTVCWQWAGRSCWQWAGRSCWHIHIWLSVWYTILAPLECSKCRPQVIDAGRFDMQTSMDERRATLEALLQDEDRLKTAQNTVMSWEQFNASLARGPEVGHACMQLCVCGSAYIKSMQPCVCQTYAALHAHGSLLS